jgi:hypothetical protein
VASFSDNFNRSNEALDVSANWDGVVNDFEIINNVVECFDNSVDVCALVATATVDFGDDHEAEIDIANLDVDNFVGPATRMAANGECYAVVNISTTTAQIYRIIIPGSDQALGTAFTIANSDNIRLRSEDTTHTAFVNDTQEEQVTDTDYTTGQPGMHGYNGDGGNETTMDNFVGSDDFATGGAIPRGPLGHVVHGPLGGPA